MKAIFSITSILIILSVIVLASLVVFESISKDVGLDYGLKTVAVLAILGAGSAVISFIASSSDDNKQEP